MARSFKKNLILKIAPTRKATPKRQASRRVRQSDELASGAAYKRCFNSWDICDVRLGLDKPTVDKRKKWDRVFLCK
jgi:hypothetical protein